MSPRRGDIHRRARKDSGAARLWAWARGRRASWTCPDAAASCEVSPRRTRMIVAAMYEAALLLRVREYEMGQQGAEPAEWQMSARGRKLTAAPIMVVDGKTGLIAGVRAAG
jgi:hypothetical protein